MNGDLMSSTQPLGGRVAVVTRPGRTIGRAPALALAADGAAVVVNARANQAEADAVVTEIAANGGQAISAMADIADGAAVERMVAAVVARFGRIDFLINNAALRREKPLHGMTVAGWSGGVGVELPGPVLHLK